MTPNRNEILFALWQFLNQPVFDARRPAILDFRRFWVIYQIRHLERCLSKNYKPEERFR